MGIGQEEVSPAFHHNNQGIYLSVFESNRFDEIPGRMEREVISPLYVFYSTELQITVFGIEIRQNAGP